MPTEAGNSAFDRVVQQKLNQLRPPYRPDSWERLATRLDAEQGAEDFDETIAQQLDQISVPYQPASWEALAARLDAEAEAAVFDEALGQRLQRVAAPYRPSSWEALAARLEVERQRMRAILHYKTMEVTLLLLLFMTAWQHLPLQEEGHPQDGVRKNYPIASIENPSRSATNSDATSERNAKIMEQATLLQAEAATTTLPLARPELATVTNGLIPDWATLGTATPSADAEVALLPKQDPALLANQSGPQERLAALRAEKAAAINSPADQVVSQGPMAALDGSAPPLLDYGQAEELLRYIRPSERRTFVRVGFFRWSRL